MIFQRSLIRELTQVAMAVFTVLLAIVLTTQVLKLFGRAAAGQLASDAIFAMVGFATLGSFGGVLSRPLFFSLMIFSAEKTTPGSLPRVSATFFTSTVAAMLLPHQQTNTPILCIALFLLTYCIFSWR